MSGLRHQYSDCSNRHAINPDATLSTATALIHLTWRSDAERRLGFAVTLGAGKGDDNVSIAKARSLADWKRCSGFFSRQRCTMVASTGGMFPFAEVSCAGSSFKIAFISSTPDGAE